jgi:formate hydrogenlyase transcriptional activator
LRERRDDIPLLVEHFVQEVAERQGKSTGCVPNNLLDMLKDRDWPGNIRELQNFIERAVIMTTGSVLQPHMEELKGGDAGFGRVRTLEDVERAHITSTLRETNGIVGGRNGAAAKLGLARTTLISRMQKLGIARETVPERLDQFTGTTNNISPECGAGALNVQSCRFCDHANIPLKSAFQARSTIHV